jgi:hypothetical protein
MVDVPANLYLVVRLAAFVREKFEKVGSGEDTDQPRAVGYNDCFAAAGQTGEHLVDSV